MTTLVVLVCVVLLARRLLVAVDDHATREVARHVDTALVPDPDVFATTRTQIRALHTTKEDHR